MRKIKLLFSCLVLTTLLHAQETFPVNGIADKRDGCYAFTNATIVKDAQNTIQNGTMVIRDGKIVAVGTSVVVPKDALVIDCKDKFIYPSFIDIYTDYGMPAIQRPSGGGGFGAPAQLSSNQKGAYGWNQALKSDINAYKIFSVDDAKAKPMREAGFGAVLTHQKDGIVRGTGAVVTLSGEKDNFAIVKEKAAALYSFNKGTSTQAYPSSLMGTIALLRQTYNDAAWYKNNPEVATKEGMNITLQYFNNNQSLPQIFDVQDRGIDLWNMMRADRIGDEFGIQYILKTTGKEYQRIKEVAATKAPLIVTVNFPQAQDVEDPNDARMVSLADMKNWELGPTNPAAIEKAGIPFCLTTADLRDPKTFLTNLRKAIEYGLTEKAAMEALTKNPATWLGVYDKVGSLDEGKMANFVITTAPVFSEKAVILQNWVNGNKYAIKEDAWKSINGNYKLTVQSEAGIETYSLEVKSNNTATLIGKDTLANRFSFDGKTVKINFAPMQRRIGGAGRMGMGANVPAALPANAAKLSGFNNGKSWNGTGVDSLGNHITWTAEEISLTVAKTEEVKPKAIPKTSKSFYPFTAFGNDEENIPKPETILFKNATVWTSEKAGKLEGTDVLIKNGKIAKVGKGLNETNAKIIDATGKHLTAGIIDEHSHIASASTNEGGQSVTSEVRMQDNLDPDDINIYRQLSGGVTSSHILHGSANTIGGQTQLIKLRWGTDDKGLMFEGADPFIKFALGENVKRSSSTQGNSRFPDSRMGVEQVLSDAFNRAKIYETAKKEYEANSKKKGAAQTTFRKDLELEALVEIMNSKRFITCHSYVASEIVVAMRVAEKYGFKINTFTHILEGYKVADKMKAHGAAASTFSDWWAYKNEVQDAIPYNATIMHKVGLNVAINSDDAEMARRLNQEAAKSVKYGGMSEIEALNMVTINPAKMLHVDNKVGSIKEGKDADLVLWSAHPLSIYAKSLYTVVDGTIYYDRAKDEAMRKEVKAERTRLISKMVGEKRTGAPMAPFTPSFKYVHTCLDHGHKLGLLEIEAGEEEGIEHNNNH
ncbi:amidohydrolase family protein [Sediminibacterium sp.]|uniref:amidohydrolase family protein n=1 Tax=Sediminibacterium sp. TaxID=1917865 RepID=UPI003F6F9C94